MEVQVTLKDYLKRLEVAELDKPESQRLAVPSLAELARAAGVSREAMSKFANNYRRGVNLDILNSIIAELRRRGFNPAIEELLTIREGSEEEGVEEEERGELMPAGMVWG